MTKTTRSNRSAPAAIVIAGNIIHFPTLVHCAIFNEVLKAEIVTEGGRWYAIRTKEHHTPFVDSIAIVAPEGASMGVQFVAKKLNYNFNDSTWFASQPEKLVKILEVGLKAVGEGKTFTKKDALYFLADMKEILKASTFKAPEPAPAAPATTEAPKVEETEVA